MRKLSTCRTDRHSALVRLRALRRWVKQRRVLKHVSAQRRYQHFSSASFTASLRYYGWEPWPIAPAKPTFRPN